MADSLLDLGATSDIFTQKPDYADGISSGLDFGRDVLQFNAGLITTRNRTHDLAMNLVYNFQNLSKETEYYLVNFFCTQRGQNKRFWLPVWEQSFKLAAAISVLSYTFQMTDNHFNDVARFYERIFIYTKTGDLITRKLLSCVGNVFTVETAFDRDLAVDDVLYFGRLVMARFGQDELDVKHVTNTISSAEASFIELPKEYESSATGS